MEALGLRGKDVDFGRRLQHHLRKVRDLHQSDLALGWGEVMMPDALARKVPNVAREWAWQCLFPQKKRWHDPTTGAQRRHHLVRS
jgi:hypothetical protein